MDFWSKDNPCVYCGAINNTDHLLDCVNRGLYDAEGRSLLSMVRRGKRQIHGGQLAINFDEKREDE